MRLVAALGLVAWLGGCRAAPDPTADPGSAGAVAVPAPAGAAAPATPPAAEPPWPVVTAADGHALLERYECHRCHAGTGLAAPPPERDCTGCHRAIRDGGFLNPRGLPFTPTAEELGQWRQHVRHGLDVPTLTATRQRLRRGWIATFLAAPHDLRPALEDTMPALPVTPGDARALAAFLGTEQPVAIAPPGGDPIRGRRLLDQRGCGSCHAFTGVEPLARSPIPVTLTPDALGRAIAGAPDLRHARDRFGTWSLVTWLRQPSAVKSDTLMPDLGLTAYEARDLAAYLIGAKLAPLPVRAAPRRLARRDTPVSFAEVERRVFRTSCWHCHSDPDYAFGDGGPGNTGGFGFLGRGVQLATFEGVRGGYLAPDGQRQSLLVPASFALTAGAPKLSLPRLVASLLARHAEVAGQRVPGLRGMPLGLPPIPLADVELVESWIAQGAPR